MDPITQITKGTQETPPTVTPETNKISPDKLYRTEGQQNLVHPITVISSEGQQGLWRSVVLDVCVVLLAAAFGYSFSRYLAGGLSYWFVLGSLLLWSAASVIEGFLQKSFSRRFLIIFLEAIALVIWFHAYAWQALAVAGILALLALLWGYFSVRRELRNTIEIRFFTASGKVIGKVVTAAVILMIIMYASLMNNNGSFFVSQNGFNTFFAWATALVNNYYPSVKLDGSFEQFAQTIAQVELQGKPTYEAMTPDQKDAALKDATTQIMQDFSPAATGTIPVATTDQPTSNAFYTYFAGLAAKLQSRFSNLFVGAWGLILFLILRSIGIIFVWVGEFVTLIFYELFLATGFMKIREESGTKEVIEY